MDAASGSARDQSGLGPHDVVASANVPFAGRVVLERMSAIADHLSRGVRQLTAMRRIHLS
jgi:hypothetical protein